MIRHVSLLTLRPDTTPEQVAAIFDGLSTLPGAIDAIAGYAFGRDLALAEDNADVAIVADFADLAGYETYRDHPAHRAVITELVAPVLAGRTAAQYEVPDAGTDAT